MRRACVARGRAGRKTFLEKNNKRKKTFKNRQSPVQLVTWSKKHQYRRYPVIQDYKDQTNQDNQDTNVDLTAVPFPFMEYWTNFTILHSQLCYSSCLHPCGPPELVSFTGMRAILSR